MALGMGSVSLFITSAVWMAYHDKSCKQERVIPSCTYTWLMQVLLLLMGIATLSTTLCNWQPLMVGSLILTFVVFVYSLVYLFASVSDDLFKY